MKVLDSSKMSFTSLLMMVLAVSCSHAAETRLTTLPCGSSTMNPGERVIIQSPGFPSPYTNNQRCQYEITCNPKESTYLEFICPTFQLEQSSGCVNDRLIVTYTGTSTTKCGTNSPDGTVTTDGWTRLTFASNSATTAPGFRCYIWCRSKIITTTTSTSTTTLFTNSTISTSTPTSTTTTTFTPSITIPTTTTPTTTTAAPTTTTTPDVAPVG